MNRLTRRLLAFFLLNAVVLNVVLIFLFATSWKETVVYESFIFLHRTGMTVLQREIQYQGMDSWRPMIWADEYLQSNGKEPLYDKIFFESNIKFQYPPSSLLIVRALKSLTGQKDMIYLVRILGQISVLFVFITALFTWLIFRSAAVQVNAALLDRLFQAALILLFAITFYPLVKGFRLGQVQTWITAVFAILFFFYRKEKEGISGFLTGILCLLKPQYGLFVIWALLRKKIRFAVAFAFAIACGLGLSLWLFGLENHFNYVKVLQFLGKHGESYYANQSVNGLLNRLFFTGDILNFQKQLFPGFDSRVYTGTLISSLLLIGLAFFLPWRKRTAGNLIDFSIISVTSILASPVAWDHHYGILLPIFAFVVPWLIANRANGWIVVTTISYVLISNEFAVANRLANATSGLNVLLSYQFFGGILFLVCLYMCLQKQVEQQQPAEKVV
jgi:hypothetical protein